MKPEKLPASYSGVPTQALESQAAWITDQLSQGRSEFTLSPVYTGNTPHLVLCAW